MRLAATRATHSSLPKSFAERFVACKAERTQRAVDAPVGQHDGRAEVRANAKWRGRQLRRCRVRGGVVHQARQAVQHKLAKRLFDRRAASRGDDFGAGTGIDVLEQALAAADFGQKDRIHAQVLAQLVQHLAHGFVDQGVAAGGGGDEQFAHRDFKVFGRVVPQIQTHGVTKERLQQHRAPIL